MEIDDVKRLVASTAINNMLSGGFFSICVIRSVAEALDITPHRKIFKVLEALHCVPYHKMPDELRAELPSIILRCLTLEPTKKISSEEIVVKKSWNVLSFVRNRG